VRPVTVAPTVGGGAGFTPVLHASQLRVGATVRVSGDEALVTRLAPEHGGWTASEPRPLRLCAARVLVCNGGVP
jgi:hypothetical protein